MDYCKNCIDFAASSCREKCEPRSPDATACTRFRSRANNNQIDNTDYYRLPDGTQLEDAMWSMMLDGPTWSAVKYLYRAGKKTGESVAKDSAKAMHFAQFRAGKEGTTVEHQLHFFANILDAIMLEHKGA